jgi:hypothetical protein
MKSPEIDEFLEDGMGLLAQIIPAQEQLEFAALVGDVGKD